ncbi:hypothetical protein B5F08_05405 [Anaeromassilibacillus sp. An172]|nr:hypothetical protein B5F08_05405 [Anaeromassilibacillus sp. An172]
MQKNHQKVILSTCVSNLSIILNEHCGSFAEGEGIFGYFPFFCFVILIILTLVKNHMKHKKTLYNIDIFIAVCYNKLKTG